MIVRIPLLKIFGLKLKIFRNNDLNRREDNGNYRKSIMDLSDERFCVELFLLVECTLLTNQNYIQEEIKCRIKAGNSCYYSVQTLLSSRLLSKILKIKIYKTIILPVALYG